MSIIRLCVYSIIWEKKKIVKWYCTSAHQSLCCNQRNKVKPSLNQFSQGKKRRKKKKKHKAFGEIDEIMESTSGTFSIN